MELLYFDTIISVLCTETRVGRYMNIVNYIIWYINCKKYIMGGGRRLCCGVFRRLRCLVGEKSGLRGGRGLSCWVGERKKERGHGRTFNVYYNIMIIMIFPFTSFLRRLDRSKEHLSDRENTMASIYRACRMFLCKLGAVNVWNPPTNFWTRQMQISIFCNSEMN